MAGFENYGETAKAVEHENVAKGLSSLASIGTLNGRCWRLALEDLVEDLHHVSLGQKDGDPLWIGAGCCLK